MQSPDTIAAMKDPRLITFLKCLLAGAFAAAEIACWSLSPAIAAGVVVSGQVRNDLNSNGDIYESDPGIGGVTVKLYQDDGTGNATGSAIATATTNANGNYSFSGVTVGNYIIVETNPTNFVSSGDTQGANDDKIAVSVGTFDKTNNIFLDVDTTLLDYGDAPNTYSTLLASNGARHTRDGKLFLGAGVTGEADGQPSSTATVDANDDSVTFSPSLGANYSTLIQSGVANTVTVISSSSGYLNAWVDYNQDGDFNDPGEQILTNNPVSAGNNALNFSTPPPNTILHGPTFARFRLSPSSISTPSTVGSVSGGEVEDYQVNVGTPIPNGTACTTTGLINGEFDAPSVGSSTPNIGVFAGGDIKIYDETLVPGWNTTALDPTYTGTTNTGGIEIWKNGVNGGNGATFAYNNAGQFAEINAYQAAALFQDIATVPGATLTWQFAHRARVGVDTLNVRIGSPNLTLVQRTVSTDTSGWVFYRGTYVVPAGQYITRFAFEAISTGSGSVGSGNFIDAVQFSTNSCVTVVSPPTIDLDTNNSTGATGNNFRGIFVGGGTQRPAADTDVTITDDKTDIASASITLTNRPDGNTESLSIDPTVGGTVSGVTAIAYNSSTGKLTLNGSTTLVNYAKIIATLKYQNTKTNPNSSDRRITVQVTDSNGLLSNLAISTLSLKLPPTIDLDGDDSSGVAGNDYTNKFVVGGGAVRAADPDVVVTDDGANLKSATITLTNRPDGIAETLTIDVTAGGTVSGVTATSYNASTGQLTLNGPTTLANYQAIVATLKYNNTSVTPNTTNRVINIQVTDSDNLTSNLAVSTLQVQSLSFSGTVFVDLDANKVQNGTEVGYTEGGLYAILVDSNNKVADSVAVSNSNGSYSFSNLSPNQTYTVRLSTVAASIGQAPPPATSLPSTWGSTGENLSGTIDDPADSILSVPVAATNITNANFGLIKYLASPMAGQIVINEVLYNQSGSNTIAANDEFIELYNASSTSVDLSGWKLMDGNLIANSLDAGGSITGSNSPYVFPSGTILAPKQYAVIWIGSDRTPNPVPVGVAFHTGLGKSSKLNDTGDDVWLYDAQTRIVDYMAYGINDTNNNGINNIPPTSLNFWNNNYQSLLANTSSGQSISLTPNGIDSNASACWEPTTSSAAMSRCPNYLPTRDIDPLRTTSVGDNNNGRPNLRLVKRITAISGASLAKYIDVNVAAAPANASDDNAAYWPKTGSGVTATQYPIAGTTAGFSDYLKGIVDNTNLLSSDPPRPKPKQEVEYTIYFLSDGFNNAKNVSICDYIPEHTTFVPGSLQLSIGGATPTIKTDTPSDSDGGGYYTSSFPVSCNSSVGHTNGAVVVDLNQVDYATGSGAPASSYGFIRFRARIN